MGQTQNSKPSQVYDPAEIGEGVFIGPGVILTNDVYPRAINTDGELKDGTDWVPKGVTIKSGASIGARSVILAGVTIGNWALLGAGTVVIRDIPDYALVAGNPSRQNRLGRESRHSTNSRWETLSLPENRRKIYH